MRRLVAPIVIACALLGPSAAARAAGAGGLGGGGTSSTPTASSPTGAGGLTSSSPAATPTSSSAEPSSSSGSTAPAPKSAHGASATTTTPAAGTVRGTVVSVGWGELTVRPHGRSMAVTAALTDAADAVAASDYPYVWGGGHEAAGVPSTGEKGGPNGGGREVGYDCSGSVAAVLAGAGLWAAGTGVPSDEGIVAQLRAAHLIARGNGAVTLWDDPGVHIFMQIGTTYFGTSDGGGPSPDNPAGGAGWLDDGASDTLQRAYHPWHLTPAALAGRVVYGPTVTVGLTSALAEDAAALEVGSTAVVDYATRHRALVATSVQG